MASSSSKLRKSYHVFLSFRGPDVRNSFLGHLYTALKQTGIYTYIDNEELRKGEHISPSLMKAIEKSQIAIVVFSKGYASSPWCLEELVKIMECKEQGDLMVFPVFYKMEPRKVRTPRESYKEAIAKHESKFGKDSEEVERWKKALFDAGNLSGWHLNDGDEAELVKRIVKEISMQLDRIPLHVAKHPVGIHPQVGTGAVKAIVLDLPEPKEIYIGPYAFTKMRRLRLLIMINVHTSFPGPICLPDGLKWLEWSECPYSIQELCSSPKNLVGLGLCRSNIQVVREQFKDFKNLKFLNFSECQSLVCMPDLNYTPNLEELNLHGCKNLESAHESVAYHGKLRLLNLSGCSELHHLCDVLHANNLQSINLRDCSKLQRFPDIPDENKSLLNLYLDRTPIKELLASIENLVSLEDMTLSNCKNLAILPSSIYKLQNLERLILNGCSKLINFPKKDESSDPHMKIGFPKLKELNLRKCSLLEVDFLEKYSCFSFLRYLNLSGNNFTNLSIPEQLHNLYEVDVSYCQQLEEVLEIPGHLSELKAASCESLRKISTDTYPPEEMDLSSCYELVRHGFTVNDFVKPELLFNETRWKPEVLLPGEEMPKWLLPNKEGYISFLASKDLYEKIGGLALGFVFRVKEGMKNAKFKCRGYVNGERITKDSETFISLDSNHVDFAFLRPEVVWGEVSFGPNDYWNHFQFSITALGGMIVKKCGFRLICKSLENELEVLLQEVLLQDDQLLDSALFYEVLDENQTSTEKDSPSEFVHKGLDENQMSIEEDSPSKFVHKGLNMTDFSIEKYRYSLISPAYRNILLGGEMPEQFVLVEDGTISFNASQDLYDKVLGLTLCVVFSVEDREKEISFELVPHVNGERQNVLSGTLSSFDSDHMWIQYLESNVLWGLLEGGVDFDKFEESYLQFSLRIRVSGGIVKKLGYVLRCRQLEDDLKVVLEDNQFVDSAALYEDFDVSTSLREFLRKCHLPIEKLGYSESEGEED